jgi:hypothetical protein
VNSPGRIEIAEEFGRVDRNTAGDRNNDGFNEARGAYQINATGARLELTLAPADAALVYPVLEVRGMPAGDAVVTVEGRIIDQVVRLDDGTVLIEIPARLDRPSGVGVKVQ